MRTFLTILTGLVFFSPSYGQDLSDKRLNSISNVDFEHFSDCKTIQFAGKDSSNAKLVKSVNYDSLGNITGENYDSYRTGKSTWRVDGKYLYTYNSGGLRTGSTFYHKKDEIEIVQRFYSYNNQDKKTSVDIYNFKRRLKPSATGYHIITEEDFEEDPTWKHIGRMFFDYNQNGKLEEEYAPNLYASSQNRYTFSYDSLGRKIEERSYDHDRLIWIENYTYTKSGYFHDRIWYQNGKPHPKRPVFKFSFTTNDLGQIIEKKTIKDDKVLHRTELSYDDQGRIKRKVLFNEVDNPIFTQVTKCIGHE